MFAESNRFIVSIDNQSASIVAQPPVSFFCLEFDIEQFSDSLFGAYQIACPRSVARSVLKRRAEFLAGRLCARYALLDRCQMDSPILIGAQREPIWPAGILGSITHSVNQAAAVVVDANDYSGVGIDREIILSANDIGALCGQVLEAEELRNLRHSASDLSIELLATLCFSIKESFFKAVFPMVQRFLNFDVICVKTIDTHARLFSLEVTQTLSEQIKIGRVFQGHYCFPDSNSVMTYLLF